MKYNKSNHWITEMEVGETIYIDFQELAHTMKGNPYIIAKHDDDVIYANIGRWDEQLFQAGHTYSMTCTKCQYNKNSNHNYLQYKFEEILPGDEQELDGMIHQHQIQGNLSDYLETTSVDDDEEYLHKHHLDMLIILENRLSHELEAVRYAIRRCQE